MDQVELAVVIESEPISGRALQTLQIRVNGRALVDVARDAELACGAGPELAGGYASLCLPWLLRGRNDLHEHLLGASGSSLASGPNEKTVLMICSSCWEDGCWPLMARVEAVEDYVRWSHFEQPHRKEWDLSLGPFYFDRGRYEAEVGRAVRMLSLE